MSLLDKKVAAVFFISHDAPAASASLDALLRMAGATDLVPDPQLRGLVGCRWAGLRCDCSLAERELYRQLWMLFSHNQLNRMLRPRPEDDRMQAEPGLGLIHAFRDACDALEVDGGILIGELWQEEEAWVNEVEAELALYLTASLRARRLLMLYMDDDRASTEPPHAVFDQWDQLPAEHGRIYFSGTGRHRLY